MLQNIIEIIKIPVTTMIEQSRNEEIKKGAVKAVIISVIISFISVITEIVSIMKSVTKKYYSSSEVWERRMSKIKDAELFSSFFKQIVMYLIIIALIAGVLFVIAKLLKRPKDYSETISLINSFFMLYTIGSIAKFIISLIYAPLGSLAMLSIIVYAVLSLIHAFRDILEEVESDSLVLISTGVIVALVVVGIVIAMLVYDISFSDLSKVTDLMYYLK